MEVLTTEDIKIDGQAYLIPSKLVKQVWRRFDDKVDLFLTSVGDQRPTRTRDSGEGFSFQPLFTSDLDVSLKAGRSLLGRYSGNVINHNIQFSTDSDSNDFNYIDCVQMAKLTLTGLLEAFYLTFELYKKHAVWHGCYDRDYYFILNQRDLRDAIKAGLEPMSEVDQRKIKVGVHVIRQGSELIVSCYGYGPAGKIDKKTIKISGSNIERLTDETIFHGACFNY